MIFHRKNATAIESYNCHGGSGLLQCREMLADYKKKAPGFKYIHEDLLEPGASIGEHTHHGDEEVYIFLEGHGVMRIDGQESPVGPGDVCLTRDGQSHHLTNSADGPMRFYVICANTGEHR